MSDAEPEIRNGLFCGMCSRRSALHEMATATLHMIITVEVSTYLIYSYEVVTSSKISDVLGLHAGSSYLLQPVRTTCTLYQPEVRIYHGTQLCPAKADKSEIPYLLPSPHEICIMTAWTVKPICNHDITHAYHSRTVLTFLCPAPRHSTLPSFLTRLPKQVEVDTIRC